MLRLVSDEDVHDDIIRGLRRREPALDIVRVQDVGLDHTPDPIILEWAANNERVLLTGDLNTMVGFAWGRVQAGLPMVGVLALLETSASGELLTTSFWWRCATRQLRSKSRSCTSLSDGVRYLLGNKLAPFLDFLASAARRFENCRFPIFWHVILVRPEAEENGMATGLEMTVEQAAKLLQTHLQGSPWLTAVARARRWALIVPHFQISASQESE